MTGSMLTNSGQLAGRRVRVFLRQPWFIAITLVQPMIWLLLFGQLFKGITAMPGLPRRRLHRLPDARRRGDDGDVLQRLERHDVITDLDRGVMDRFLVTPVRRGSLIAGDLGYQGLTTVLQTVIVLAIGWVAGARFPGGWRRCWRSSSPRCCWGAHSPPPPTPSRSLCARRSRSSASTSSWCSRWRSCPRPSCRSALAPAWIQHVARWNPVNWAVEVGRESAGRRSGLGRYRRAPRRPRRAGSRRGRVVVDPGLPQLPALGLTARPHSELVADGAAGHGAATRRLWHRRSRADDRGARTVARRRSSLDRRPGGDGADRGGHLDRQRHPRLPGAERACGPRTPRPSGPRTSSTTCPTRRSGGWRGRAGSTGWSSPGRPTTGTGRCCRSSSGGRCTALVTQNIDGLHQAAGSDPARIVEIHGTVHEVVCLACGRRTPMDETLDRVRAGEDDPACLVCGGMLKSATISFGQSLVEADLERAFEAAAAATCCWRSARRSASTRWRPWCRRPGARCRDRHRERRAHRDGRPGRRGAAGLDQRDPAGSPG